MVVVVVVVVVVSALLPRRDGGAAAAAVPSAASPRGPRRRTARGSEEGFLMVAAVPLQCSSSSGAKKKEVGPPTRARGGWGWGAARERKWRLGRLAALPEESFGSAMGWESRSLLLGGKGGGVGLIHSSPLSSPPRWSEPWVGKPYGNSCCGTAESRPYQNPLAGALPKISPPSNILS